MDKEQRLNFISALFTLIIGVVFLILSRGIEVKAKNGDVGSAFFPALVGGLMVILSVLYNHFYNFSEEETECSSVE